MTTLEIVAMLENRLTYNAQQRAAAVARGDVALVAVLDADTATTAVTLSEIRPVE
jgi:hypothetical protein